MIDTVVEWIGQGDLEAIEHFLDQKQDGLFIRDQVGNSLVSLAILHRQNAILRCFLQRGAMITNDASILTSIVAGINENWKEMADLLSMLVKVHGLDINLPISVSGESLLIAASSKGSLEIVHTLLSLGADLHHKDSEGKTALSQAYLNYQVDVVKLLLTCGANVEDPMMDIFIACTLGQLDRLRPLLTNIPNISQFVNTFTYGFHEETLFRRACTCNHLHIVQYLIRLGADVNMQYSGRYTMLMFAAGSGHLPLVRLLVKNGALLNKQNEYGWTALMYATMESRTAVVRFLLKEGANPNLRTHLNQSIFSLASNEEINQLITEHMSAASIRKLNWSEWYHLIVEGATWG